MDFPQFFQRPSRFQSITTRWYRGLACLTQDPARREQETIQPVTGECFSDNDNPIHVINKPMNTVGGVPLLAVATILAAKPGVRYFIHSANITVRLIAADTTTSASLLGTFRGVGGNVFHSVSTVPSVAGSYNVPAVLDILTDENTAVTAACGVANPASALVFLTYSEVGTA
jgi:hypothetical protein